MLVASDSARTDQLILKIQLGGQALSDKGGHISRVLSF